LQFLELFKQSMFCLAVFWSIVRIFVDFSDGNEMHLFIPLKSQPIISFEVVYFLSPLWSFFIEMGSSSGIFVSCGGGKI